MSFNKVLAKSEDVIKNTYNDNQNELERAFTELENELSNEVSRLGTEIDTVVEDLEQKNVGLNESINEIKDSFEILEVSLTPNSGWTSNSGTWGQIKAKKIGKVVYLEGLVTGGEPNSTIVNQIPEGFRPFKNMRFRPSAAGVDTFLSIMENGSILCLGTNTTNIFFDGITYITK